MVTVMGGQKKRDSHIGTRVNDQERRIIEQRAKEANIGVAEAMRRLILQSSRGEVRGAGGTKRES